MNDELIKFVNPFFEPSIGAQIAEAQEEKKSIRQSVQIKQAALHGNNQMAFNQIGQIGQVVNIVHSGYSKAHEEFLSQCFPKLPDEKKMLVGWIQSLPQPRLKNAVKNLIELSLEVFFGNYSAAARFLGTSRRVTRYRLPTFTRELKNR